MDRKKLIQVCRSQRKSNSWALDFDYLKKLGNDELSFLAEFCLVHYQASPHRCTHLNISVEDRRESYRSDYKRRVDILNIQKTTSILEFENNTNSVIEDILIEIIDNKIK